jgi:ABC-type multidrug transport system ATPase subunit
LLNLDKKTIEKQIGQIDWLGEYPSGGERRRINIAHELVLEPEVLVLDEPTSGLSSKDSEDLMNSLELLAKRKKICIVMTIHQPSGEMFRKIDDLLLLVRGGKLAYYGRRELALDWLRKSPPRAGDKVKESVNEAETILSMIDAKSAPERYPVMFEEFLRQNGGGPTKYNG